LRWLIVSAKQARFVHQEEETTGAKSDDRYPGVNEASSQGSHAFEKTFSILVKTHFQNQMKKL